MCKQDKNDKPKRWPQNKGMWTYVEETDLQIAISFYRGEYRNGADKSKASSKRLRR